jgi:hypothetical protein
MLEHVAIALAIECRMLMQNKRTPDQNREQAVSPKFRLLDYLAAAPSPHSPAAGGWGTEACAGTLAASSFAAATGLATTFGDLSKAKPNKRDQNDVNICRQKSNGMVVLITTRWWAALPKERSWSYCNIRRECDPVHQKSHRMSTRQKEYHIKTRPRGEHMTQHMSFS